MMSQILQHIYTRERKGMYSAGPGYDSIAKSENLFDDLYIKNVLHPMCFYQEPTTIEDTKNYPDILSIFSPDKDSIVITNTSYKQKDYTGYRSAYFSHQFIFTGDYKQLLLSDISRGIYIEEFIRDWDVSRGIDIPQIKHVAFNRKKSEEIVIDNYLYSLGIEREKHKEFIQKLVFAVFYAQKHNAIIYISFDGDQSLVSSKCCRIVRILFSLLPLSERRNFGFISFLARPVRKKGIILEGIEKGGIKKSLEISDVDCSFDLVNGVFGEEIYFRQEYNKCDKRYLEFLWRHIKDRVFINGFYKHVNNCNTPDADKTLQWVEDESVEYEKRMIKKFSFESSFKDLSSNFIFYPATEYYNIKKFLELIFSKHWNIAVKEICDLFNVFKDINSNPILFFLACEEIKKFKIIKKLESTYKKNTDTDLKIVYFILDILRIYPDMFQEWDEFSDFLRKKVFLLLSSDVERGKNYLYKHINSFIQKDIIGFYDIQKSDIIAFIEQISR
jgi:hypothetical protein